MAGPVEFAHGSEAGSQWAEVGIAEFAVRVAEAAAVEFAGFEPVAAFALAIAGSAEAEIVEAFAVGVGKFAVEAVEVAFESVVVAFVVVISFVEFVAGIVIVEFVGVLAVVGSEIAEFVVAMKVGFAVELVVVAFAVASVEYLAESAANFEDVM